MSNHTSPAHNRIPPEAYHALALSRGFEWIGDYSDSRTKTAWRCSLGHEWMAPYYSLQAGSGCPKCRSITMREKLLKPAEQYHALAAKWGISWIGEKVCGADEPTLWRCSQGHEWKATYSNIKKGSLCPPCGDERAAVFRRKSPWDYANLGREHNLIWLGPVVKSTWQHTQWQCACGNVWSTSYDAIQKVNCCPKCGIQRRSEGRRLKPSAYHKMAISSGITWIGPEVYHSRTPTGWRCSEGHEWKASYNSIQHGTNCPYCQNYLNGAKVSQIQLSLASLLKGAINLKVGTYYIDVAVQADDIKIAVEYDAYYWHRQVKDMTVFEQNRDRYLIQRDWRVIHVRSNELLPTIEQLDCAIEEILNGQTVVEIVLDDWRG